MTWVERSKTDVKKLALQGHVANRLSTLRRGSLCTTTKDIFHAANHLLG